MLKDTQRGRRLFVSMLRKSAETIDAARRLVEWNQSVFARLGNVAEELRMTALAFETRGRA